MSKENNLTDFLTDVASAIKDKRGIGSVNAQNFSTEIRAIEPLLDTLNITENGKHNVKDYKNVSVYVQSDADLKLKEMIEKTNIDEFEVPYGITKIGSYSLVNYMNLTLPNTIIEILSNGIQGPSSTNLYYNGTIDEYLLIRKGSTSGENFYPFHSQSGSSTITTRYLNVKNENGEYTTFKGNVNIKSGITKLPIGALSCVSLFIGDALPNANLAIIFPKTITNIEVGAFHYSITGSIIFEEGTEVEEIPLYCFDHITTFDVSDGTFSNKGIIILPKCKTIGANAFKNSTIREVILKEGLITIGSYAFSYSKINAIVLPNSLTTILNNAFQSCKDFNEIVIPKNVETIGANALDIRIKTTFTFESETPCTITSNTFNKNYINRIYVPKGTSVTYKSATNWSSFASYIFEKYVVVMNVPTALVNNETITYSIDGGKTYQQFTNNVLSLDEVATIKIKSTDSSQVVKVGTSSGASDVGTISNSELTFSFTTDTQVYLTIQ